MKFAASSLNGALLVSLVTFTLGVTSNGLVAQEATVDDASEFGERRQQRRDNTMERFDRNEDGKLGERERAAMKEKRKEFHERLDENDDGKITKRERVHDKMTRKRGKRHFEWADKNDDGELSRQEKRRAHKRFHSGDNKNKKAAR